MEDGWLIAEVSVTGEVLVLVVLPYAGQETFVLLDGGIYFSDFSRCPLYSGVEIIPGLGGRLVFGDGVYSAPGELELAAQQVFPLQGGVVNVLDLPGAAVLYAELGLT